MLNNLYCEDCTEDYNFENVMQGNKRKLEKELELQYRVTLNSSSIDSYEKEDEKEARANTFHSLRVQKSTEIPPNSYCDEMLNLKQVSVEIELCNCLVCDLELSTLSSFSDREVHINQCLENINVLADQSSIENNDFVDRGLRLKEFYCVICDISLSKRSLLSRCQHLKKCAKDNKITTKDLLLMISTGNDISSDEDDSDGEILVNNNDNNFISKQSNNITTSVPVKNAWTIMMSSAREIAKSASTGFEKTIKQSSSHPSSNTNDNSNDLSKTNIKKKRSFFNQSSSTKVGGYVPNYKKIQSGKMTVPIVVDGFQYASEVLSNCYFLTHFHSDHYIGLDKHFNCGNIY